MPSKFEQIRPTSFLEPLIRCKDLVKIHAETARMMKHSTYPPSRKDQFSVYTTTPKTKSLFEMPAVYTYPDSEYGPDKTSSVLSDIDRESGAVLFDGIRVNEEFPLNSFEEVVPVEYSTGKVDIYGDEIGDNSNNSLQPKAAKSESTNQRVPLEIFIAILLFASLS